MGADGLPNRVNTGFGHPLEAGVLGRAKRGDTLAHATIYTLYSRPCYNLALRILGERAAAEDVIQDVFLRMMDTISGFRGDAPFGSWLKRMTVNATIDVVRRNRRFAGEDAESMLANTAIAEIGAETAVDAWSLLMQLAPRARAIVLLHELEGYTHRELSALFGQSESYSKSVLSRSLQRLGLLAQAKSEGEEVE